ncbi:hypothetical protein V8C37DRAFT_378621 [Trichoderma ceciliae]
MGCEERGASHVASIQGARQLDVDANLAGGAAGSFQAFELLHGSVGGLAVAIAQPLSHRICHGTAIARLTLEAQAVKQPSELLGSTFFCSSECRSIGPLASERPRGADVTLVCAEPQVGCGRLWTEARADWMVKQEALPSIPAGGAAPPIIWPMPRGKLAAWNFAAAPSQTIGKNRLQSPRQARRQVVRFLRASNCVFVPTDSFVEVSPWLLVHSQRRDDWVTRDRRET